MIESKIMAFFEVKKLSPKHKIITLSFEARDFSEALKKSDGNSYFLKAYVVKHNSLGELELTYEPTTVRTPFDETFKIIKKDGAKANADSSLMKTFTLRGRRVPKLSLQAKDLEEAKKISEEFLPYGVWTPANGSSENFMNNAQGFPAVVAVLTEF